VKGAAGVTALVGLAVIAVAALPWSLAALALAAVLVARRG
jgi:hypothetical protein